MKGGLYTMIEQVKQDLQAILTEWKEQKMLDKKDIFVIGCSTSEVIGEQIGTSGSGDVATVIYKELAAFAKEQDIYLAFQCCEHLNRALCIERTLLERDRLPEVNVIPVPTAGGSMASHAYEQMEDPVMVEFIQGDAGMDIGETLIGMQLKHVAVPLRMKKRSIGEARVNFARTRPKLIGGARAHYESTRLNNSCK